MTNCRIDPLAENIDAIRIAFSFGKIGVIVSLTSQLKNLSPQQIKSLSDTMLNASIAFETGGNYREVFRRAKQRRIGLMRRIYELLEQAPYQDIENLSKVLAEPIDKSQQS
ncbi:hypothetical protein [Methylomonas sp. AM2-LC]|uniref:hypothetical protein n=1 Tax=Methylomonas sp. AM2-LC TaxID=3153301 RepID=UPI0032669541